MSASFAPRILAQTLATAFAALLVAGCSGAPILANPPVVRPTPPETSPAPPRPADPVPIELPRDDGPHDRLTEWWYFTGHLRDDAGGSWGFEYVVFRAERGAFPVTWASHLALTDETGGRFGYAQRTEIGPQVARDAGEGGFNLAVQGTPGGVGTDESAWRMGGTDTARLIATAREDEVAGAIPEGFGLDLLLRTGRPPVLHDEDGWIDFGPAGGSYYYSRTRMSAVGALTVGDDRLEVEGTAWFDHQWGDFISVGGGGWDWFAVNLDDGTDLTLSLVRDADGSYPLVYGTLVEADGSARHLERDAFSVEVTDRWTSPRTGADYPAGWRITVPSETLEIDLRPTVADQELDTRASTGVVYWEGSQVVRARRDGTALRGDAYVELTGYAPAGLTAGD
ncbi:MAG TPA: lipocalin family protein [Candidatus Limnocylindrales bacterium]|nr:lipocalin family protein [Candidatus Limnocylindrales bacterium]